MVEPFPRCDRAEGLDTERTGVRAALAADLRDSAHTVPGFDRALDRHRLLSAVEVASRARTARTPAAGRPGNP